MGKNVWTTSHFWRPKQGQGKGKGVPGCQGPLINGCVERLPGLPCSRLTPGRGDSWRRGSFIGDRLAFTKELEFHTPEQGDMSFCPRAGPSSLFCSCSVPTTSRGCAVPASLSILVQYTLLGVVAWMACGIIPSAFAGTVVACVCHDLVRSIENNLSEIEARHLHPVLVQCS